MLTAQIRDFLDRHYQNAVELSRDFAPTRQLDWTPLVILNELTVQIGHVYNNVYQNPAIDEPGRQFPNLGDELSDILLQLIALVDALGLSLEGQDFSVSNIDPWQAMPSLLGQLSEAVMEKSGYRFQKPRQGFSNLNAFIIQRISLLVVVTFQIADRYQLDLNEEFSLMLKDARQFLTNFDAAKIAEQGI